MFDHSSIVNFTNLDKNCNASPLLASAILIDQLQLMTTFTTNQSGFNFEDPEKPLKESVTITFHAKRLEPAEKQRFLENVRDDFHELVSGKDNYQSDLSFNQNKYAQEHYFVEFAHFLPAHF